MAYIREDPAFVKENSIRRAFFKGHNSTCRTHICMHWAIYKAKCEEAGIAFNHRCIPWPIWREMQAQKLGEKGKKQSTLDGAVQKVSIQQEFTKPGILEAIAKLIACDDQVGPEQLCKL